MTSNNECTLSIYLKGNNLIPSDVSDLIGCIPTKAFRLGDAFKTTDGSQGRRRTGLWAVVRQCSVEQFEQCLREMLGPFTSFGRQLTSINGVETCYCDVYIAQHVWLTNSSGVAFGLNRDDLVAIADLGLALEIKFDGFATSS